MKMAQKKAADSDRGTAPVYRHILAIIVATVPVTAARAVDLESVLRSTAVTPPARVAFSEERHNPMFREPMVVDGYLEYLGDGVLRKVIEVPFHEDILVDSDEVVLTRDGRTQRLPLSRSRAMQTILGAINAVLAGDSEALENSFECYIGGYDDAWILRMTPRSRTVARRISSLQISGNADAVGRIRIELADDEWHLMRIGDAQAEE